MFNLKKSILYLLLLTAICIICFRSVSQSPKSEKPKYRYFLRHETEIADYYPSRDTISMVMAEMGRSMTVDRADALRAIMEKHMQKLIGKVIVDSVLIK